MIEHEHTSKQEGKKEGRSFREAGHRWGRNGAHQGLVYYLLKLFLQVCWVEIGMDTREEEEFGKNWEFETDTYIILKNYV